MKSFLCPSLLTWVQKRCMQQIGLKFAIANFLRFSSWKGLIHFLFSLQNGSIQVVRIMNELFERFHLGMPNIRTSSSSICSSELVDRNFQPLMMWHRCFLGVIRIHVQRSPGRSAQLRYVIASTLVLDMVLEMCQTGLNWYIHMKNSRFSTHTMTFLTEVVNDRFGHMQKGWAHRCFRTSDDKVHQGVLKASKPDLMLWVVFFCFTGLLSKPKTNQTPVTYQ